MLLSSTSMHSTGGGTTGRLMMTRPPVNSQALDHEYGVTNHVPIKQDLANQKIMIEKHDR